MSRTSAAQAAPFPARLYLLGSFRVEREGRVIRLGTRKVELLLAYLALHPEPHAREHAAALFWGDSTDAEARRSLRVALTSLRNQLDHALVLADRETVQLNPDAGLWVDAREFQAQTVQFLAHDPLDVSDLRTDLYRGDLLSDSYDEWIAPEREQYRSLYLEGLLHLTRYLRARGEYARAIEYAGRALCVDPANERAHQHRMFCFFALGDRRAALGQYAECKRLLREELAVEPSPDTVALYERIQQASSRSPETRMGNLPVPLTSFIGRRQKVARVKELLMKSEAAPDRAPTRLLTLMGPGGCGKTRLAIQVGAELAECFPDGVWWVALDALKDAALVLPAVARVLGIREEKRELLEQTLPRFLSGRRLLLLLDNCEHLVAECAQVAEMLLRQCPHLQILTTSREALGVAGEVSWLVPSLSLPSRHAPPESAPPALLQWEAVSLFVERARAVNREFALTPANAPAIVEVCRALDGIPLAIELAAARVRALSVEQIAARLDDCLNLLTLGTRTALPRQQTLRATIDWSYDLLPPVEQTLFRRLGVFAGSWTLEAANAICPEEVDAPASVLRGVSRLVDKSLLAVEYQQGRVSYRMLDTLQAYAREKLREAGEDERARDLHLQYYLSLAEQAEPELTRPPQAEWLQRLDLDYSNLRSALEWACERGGSRGELGLRLAAALWRFWHINSLFREGREWLGRLLQREDGHAAKVPPSVLAKALNALGMIAYTQADYAEATWRLEQALELARQADDTRLMATILNAMGLTAKDQRDHARAARYFDESLSIRRAQGDGQGVAVVLNNLGEIATVQGDYARAFELYGQAVAVYREVGDHYALAVTLVNLARAHFDCGDAATARELAKEGLALSRRLGYKRLVPFALEQLATIGEREGQLMHAAKLFGAAQAWRETVGEPVPLVDRAYHASQVAAVQAKVEAAAFAVAWEEGRHTPLEQAIEEALEL